MSIYDFSNVYELGQKQAQDNSPLNRFAQGFQIGSFMRQQQALSAEKEAKAEELRKKTEQAGLIQTQLNEIAAIQDPTEKVNRLTNLGIQYPALVENVNKISQNINEQAKAIGKDTYLPILYAIKNKNYDVAKKMALQGAEAFKNSGNNRGYETLQGVVNRIDNNENLDTLFVDGSMLVSSILGWDTTMQAMKAGEETTQQGLKTAQEQSTTIIKSEEAKRAPLETQIKQEEAAQSPYKTQEQIAKTTEQQAKAKYAEQNQQLDVQNKQAELALTNQQKLVAVANAKKINKELENLTKQVNAGVINIADPEKRFKFEMDLRNQYQKESGDFLKTRDAFDKVQSVYSNYIKPNKDGKIIPNEGETEKQAIARQANADTSLVYSYMKMLDPGAAVMQGDYANATNTTGIPDYILNLYNKARQGERLNPEQRYAIYSQSKGFYEKAKKRDDDLRSGLISYAENYNLNTKNIFSEPKGIVTRDK